MHNLDPKNPTHRPHLQKLHVKQQMRRIQPLLKPLGKVVRTLSWTVKEFSEAAQRGSEIMAEMQKLPPTDPRFIALNDELKGLTAAIVRAGGVAAATTPKAQRLKEQIERKLLG